MDNRIFWKIDEVMEATGAVLLSGADRGVLFRGVSTDSRGITPGSLFLALSGEHFDGHDFIEKAVRAGASGVVTEKSKWPSKKEFFFTSNLPVFGVDHGHHALGDLARYRRRQCETRVIAVTGSNGKTSTKEFLKSIFGEEGLSFLATEGNLNNEVGLPLTLLGLRPENRWAILELGINHPGEMTRLSAICEPDIALITRIDPAHLEGLGSLEGVARAKGEIFSGMKPGGIALVNGSDPGSSFLALRDDLSNLFFGTGDSCDFKAENVKMRGDGFSFDMKTPDGKTLVLETGIPGIMMAENALAAAAAAWAAGISGESIQKGILGFKGFPGRFEKMEGPFGSVLINDTYNANPESMGKALAQLALLAGSSRRIAVLGSMGELGEESEKLHFRLGSLAAKTGVDILFCFGPQAEQMIEGAKEAGLQEVFTGSKEEIAKKLESVIGRGDWILVKGSRSMTMDTVVHDLCTMK